MHFYDETMCLKLSSITINMCLKMHFYDETMCLKLKSITINMCLKMHFYDETMCLKLKSITINMCLKMHFYDETSGDFMYIYIYKVLMTRVNIIQVGTICIKYLVQDYFY